MDDPTLEDYNVPDVVARFNALIDQQVNFTAGSDMMIMMATDFSMENAPVWFRNIDALIHHVNANGTYNALYSTPSIYTAAKIANTPLPQRTEDVYVLKINFYSNIFLLDKFFIFYHHEHFPIYILSIPCHSIACLIVMLNIIFGVATSLLVLH
jgi:Glycosyl hydrolases family 38 N-terminal domain